MSEQDTKTFVLAQRKEGRLVYMGVSDLVSVNVAAFITQPADGILYDLNRLEEVVLTFIDDPKWVNDFAVALTIRELHATLAATQAKLDKAEALLRSVAFSGHDLNDPRIGWVDVQIDRDVWEMLRERANQ